MLKNIFYLLFIFIFSCKSQETDDKIINFSINDTISTSYDKVFSSVDIIPLETSPNSLIVQIDKLVTIDNFNFVLDRAQESILVFDSLGNFSHKISKQGSGPGEYGRISDFAYNKFENTLEVLSPNGVVNSYTIQGEWVEDYIIPEFRSTHLFEVLDKDHVGLFSTDYRLTENFGIYSKSNDKIIYKTHTPPSIFEKNFISISRNPIKKSEDYIVFCQPFGNEIFKVSTKGLDKIHVWNFGDLTFKNENFTHLEKASEEEVFEEFRNSFGTSFVSFLNYLENQDLIFAQFVHNSEVKTVLVSKENKTQNVLSNFSTQSVQLFSEGIQVTCNSEFYENQIKHKLLIPTNLQSPLNIDKNDNPIILKFKFIDN